MARRRRRSRRWGGGFRAYVPVSERRRRTAIETRHAADGDQPLDPVRVKGRQIGTTPWGRAWSTHIERFHDYANRLPRGRTYLRNGSVYHLAIVPGEIRARVMGSMSYEQRVAIAPCAPATWKRLRERCAGGIGSLIELLEGRLSSAVMRTMTQERDGLLPDLKHVELSCSCPDWAILCKHLAAVLYGVAARLDERPELLFTLRAVDPADLVDAAALPGQSAGASGARRIEGDLSSVFGIELDEEVGEAPPVPAKRASSSRTRTGSARKPASPRRAARVRRQELLALGVPPGTIATWLRQGVLEPTAERAIYRHTRESRARVKRYGG